MTAYPFTKPTARIFARLSKASLQTTAINATVPATLLYQPFRNYKRPFSALLFAKPNLQQQLFKSKPFNCLSNTQKMPLITIKANIKETLAKSKIFPDGMGIHVCVLTEAFLN